jgi:hypothetical protein
MGKGQWLSCFDEGARQFDFVRAIQMLSDWFDDNAETCFYENWSGCFVSEREIQSDMYEYYEIDRRTIAIALLGKELAQHV